MLAIHMRKAKNIVVVKIFKEKRRREEVKKRSKPTQAQALKCTDDTKNKRHKQSNQYE